MLKFLGYYNVGQVEPHFLVRLEIVLMLAQDRCIVYTGQTIGSEIILEAPDGTLGDVGLGEARFGLFGDSFKLVARYANGLH
jgi:hypothetical protein